VDKQTTERHTSWKSLIDPLCSQYIVIWVRLNAKRTTVVNVAPPAHANITELVHGSAVVGVAVDMLLRPMVAAPQSLMNSVSKY